MKCSTPHCRNRRRKDRLTCSRCYMRQWRANNRLQAAFCTLRDHARARCIEFALDFETFKAFVAENDYLEQTGPFKMCMTVDRIDNLRGYVPGNLQPLTREANSRKRNKQDEIRHKAGYAWK